MYSCLLNSQSRVGAKANRPSTSNLQMWIRMLRPLLLSANTRAIDPKVGGLQSREELPRPSNCTTEPECGPARKSRHFQIYRWINWQRWKRLTGHSSWWALAQWHAWTGLLRFDFLSRPPWQMSYREGGGDAASQRHEARASLPTSSTTPVAVSKALEAAEAWAVLRRSQKVFWLHQRWAVFKKEKIFSKLTLVKCHKSSGGQDWWRQPVFKGGL